MNRRVCVEGLLLIAISLVSLGESLRLILDKDPMTFYDPVGPGCYLLIVSLGLLITGLIYIFHHFRKGQPITKEEPSGDIKFRFMGSFLSCALYFILMDNIGYATASFVFFLIMFRVIGLRSWVRNFALSLILCIAFYVIFVKYCNMVFPSGILF